MPKTSQGGMSKRLTLRAKHKVMRKVKEHHKKKRKELRKSGRKDKGPKDPGLPSQWPFKEELVKEYAFRRQQILADEQVKKDEKKARRLAAKNGLDTEGDDEAELQAAAAKKEVELNKKKLAALDDKDCIRKAFYREFKQVVESSDVVIQVLDARDPLSCRCPDVERYIHAANPNKRIILLLNKMDLVPREVGEQWLAYFRKELPTVAFKCSTQQQALNIKAQKKLPSSKRTIRSDGDDGLETTACLGADTLVQLLKNYCRTSGIKTPLTVGVIGLPNVGKSSLINSLKKARVTQVGNAPGITKEVQEVQLDKNIKLLDSPGIVFSPAAEGGDTAAVLMNSVKVDKLEDVVSPVAAILKRVPAKQLMAMFKVPAFTEFEENSSEAEKFLQLVAGVRGKLKKGGVPDVRAAARVVLNEWNEGRIPYYTSPPAHGKGQLQKAAVVSSWAKEFETDEVFATEKSAVLAHLPSMHEDEAAPSGKPPRSFFELESLGAAKVELEAMAAEAAADAMEVDEEKEAPAKKKKVKAAKSTADAASLLSSEAGQSAGVEVKKLKKVAMASSTAPDDEEGSDFEFGDADSGDDEEEGESEDEGEDGEEEEEDKNAMSG